MPRMYRFRVVGLKYNKMKKRYDDKTFQFHNNQEAVSALISLVNGGGKGALLQTISQIMIPGTSWGAKDERKFKHFFYNEKAQFKPYVFYVLIEWLLDTPDRQFLLTGVVLTAEQVITKNGEEVATKIKPKFKLFTKNYTDDSTANSLSNLPLEIILNFEKAVSNLEDNKIELYGKPAEFYRHVESFGLSREEWEIMKRINKEEGGVKDFFKNAEDNHSLFHLKIIPTISQQLRRRDNNGSTTELTEIFKSQASIAKNLPVLMKRESSLRELIKWIEPFKESVQIGLDIIQDEKKNEQRGFQYVKAFEQLIGLQQIDLDQYKENITTISKNLERIDWEKANLKYAKLYRQIEELLAELKEEKLILSDINNKSNDQQKLLDHARVELLLVQRDEQVKKIQQIDNEVNTIRKSFENTEIEARLTSLQAEIKKDWEKVYPSLKLIIKNYNSYQKYNMDERKRLEKEKENQIQTRANHKSRENLLTDSINAFNSYSNEMKEEYGEKIIYKIDPLLQNLQQEYELAHKAKDQATKKYRESIEKQKDLSGKIGEIKAAIVEKKRFYDEKKLSFEQQIQQEQAIGNEISIILQEGITEDIQNWLHASQHKLMNKLQESEHNLLNARENQWKKQLDVSLSKTPYWVANHDLKMVKELLDSEVEIFYGTEFLQTLPIDKRIEELERNPLLVHGLVLTKKEWEKLNKNGTRKNILLHSPVAIFIREEMDSKNKNSFVLLEEQSQNMVLDDEYFVDWKQDINNQLSKAKELVHQYESFSMQYNKLIKKLTLLLNQPSSVDIEKIMQETKSKIGELTRDKTLEESNLQKLEAEGKTAYNEIDVQIKNIEKIEADLEKVRKYKSRKQENDSFKDELVQLQKELIKDEEIISDLGKEQEKMDNLIRDWDRVFLNWKQERKSDFKRISQVISNAEFPEISEKSDYCEKPNLNNDIFNQVFVKLTEFEALNQSQLEKNHRLDILDVERKHHADNKGKIEKKLDKLSNNWVNFPIQIENESILESKIELLEDELDETYAKQQSQNTIVNQLNGSIKSKNEMLTEIETEIVDKKKRNVETWDELDLDEKGYSIEVEYHKVSQEEIETNELIFLTQGKINEYVRYKDVIKSNLSENIDVVVEASIVQLLQEESEKIVGDWTKQRRSLVSKKDKQHLEIDIAHSKLKQQVNGANWDLDLKTQVEKTLEKLPLREYNYVLQTIEGMHTFAISSLSQLSKDKEKAEEAQSYWATRASMKVISIIDHLKMMIKKMVIENENGYKFPLVKLKHEELPDKPEDIEYVLKQHFSKSIEQITKKFDKIENGIPELDEEINKLMSDEQIVFEALRHRYPTLMVYNLQTNNAFRYERPKDEYFSDWETINKGSEVETSGSGGQVLSARMVIMMMLLSLKSHSQKWTTLICDNPFGQAASEHVLDPIFAASELLRFQLIVVTPPELVKTEISQRFPVYYALELREEKGIEKINETVQYSFRTYHETRSVMS
ncbi:hypothetical protein [Bacillus sp. CECT 9360]|uniref:hypothetical protein n=1 Tax=Bacillus sp. CECT 9360 TaxID=2845821 RepID=UPI001E3B97C3|nr:hypothetical protein [Bacillus sp. CECT 9360]CAH0345729.1 hypothetical protein BCI9360_02027 [Bacillus sp. CECT 9360]